MKSVTDPVTGTLNYTYLPSGERKTVTYPSGETVTYEYNESQTGFDMNNGFMFDAEKPDSVSHNLQRITDSGGRRIDLVWDGVYTNYQAVGRLHGLVYNQTFNGGGEIMSYTQQHFDFDRAGNNNAFTYWNASDHGSESRSGSIRAIKTVHWKKDPDLGTWTSQLLSENRYTYNYLTGQRLTNQITDQYNNIRTETYGYDDLSRLKTVNYGDGGTQTYGFDSMGNRLSKVDGSITETYQYNSANMLLQRTLPIGNSMQAQNYTNDADGNTLSGNSRTMTWDSQNRMMSCVAGIGANQKTSSFTYGADGLRRSMQVAQAGNPTVTTNYVLDGQNVVQEIVSNSTNNTPVVAATYLSGPNGPLYRRPTSSSDVRWYVYDGTGNVTGEVNALGIVTGSKKHDVYGATRSSTGTSTSRQGWQGGVGHQSDEETGLVYMRARYYAPELGRFQSEDSKPDGVNWYIYCGNDPVNFIDETGKSKNNRDSVDWTKYLIAELAMAFCLIVMFIALKMCRPTNALAGIGAMIVLVGVYLIADALKDSSLNIPLSAAGGAAVGLLANWLWDKYHPNGSQPEANMGIVSNILGGYTAYYGVCGAICWLS